MMLRGGFVIAWVVAMSGAMGLAQAPAAQVPAGQAPAAQVQGAAPAANGPAPMLLWANGAPGALGDADDDKPTITAYIPASNPTKTAVVIAPGGSYMHLSMVKEGSDVAAWLNARGVAAFVLKYRLGPKYHNPIELGDAKRAIRTVRGDVGICGWRALDSEPGDDVRRRGCVGCGPDRTAVEPAGFSDSVVPGDHDGG